MEALAKWVREASLRLTHSGKLPEADPAFGKPRPMTGLELTAEQKKKAAAFKGDISLQSVEFARKS